MKKKNDADTYVNLPNIVLKGKFNHSIGIKFSMLFNKLKPFVVLLIQFQWSLEIKCHITKIESCSNPNNWFRVIHK